MKKRKTQRETRKAYVNWVNSTENKINRIEKIEGDRDVNYLQLRSRNIRTYTYTRISYASDIAMVTIDAAGISLGISYCIRAMQYDLHNYVDDRSFIISDA